MSSEAPAAIRSSRNSFLMDETDLKSCIDFLTSGANAKMGLPSMLLQWLRDMNAGAKILHNKPIDGMMTHILSYCVLDLENVQTPLG